MDYTLCRIYRDPGAQSTEKEASDPPKGVIWEYIRANLLLNITNTKETKLSLTRPLFWSLGTLLTPFKGVTTIEVPPLPGLPLLAIYSSSPRLTITGTLLRPFKTFNHWRPPQPKHISPFWGLSSLKSPNPGIAKTLQFHFHLLFTISHEDLLKALIYIVHGSDTYRADTSRYSVPNRKILNISTKLEYVQE